MSNTPKPSKLAVDRALCTGHGICAQLLPGVVGLDEWGYPVLEHDQAGTIAAKRAVKLCPARALYLR